MSTLVATAAPSPDDISELDKEQLRAFIGESAAATIEGIKRVARGVRLWQERGYDLAELENAIPFVQVFWMIGCGQVLAELFFRYGHTGRLWNILSRLPLPLQKQLSEAPYRLPVIAPDGSERQVDPLELTKEQIRQVFDTRDSRIRGPAEQQNIIDQERAMAHAEYVPELDAAFRITKRGPVFLHPVSMTWAEYEAILKQRPERR